MGKSRKGPARSKGKKKPPGESKSDKLHQISQAVNKRKQEHLNRKKRLLAKQSQVRLRRGEDNDLPMKDHSSDEDSVEAFDQLISAFNNKTDRDGSDDGKSSSDEEAKLPDAQMDDDSDNDNIVDSDDCNGEEVGEENTTIQDNYCSRIGLEMNSELAEKISDKTVHEKRDCKWQELGDLKIITPPNSTTGDLKLLQNSNNLQIHNVRKRLCDRWPQVNEDALDKCGIERHKLKGQMTKLQLELFSVMDSYKDLCYTNRNHKKADEIRNIYCLHALNHILKNRAAVRKHNAKLQQLSQSGVNTDDAGDEFRDQGLTRPKVLILAPFRNSALKIVKTMLDLLQTSDKVQVLRKKRFFEEFGSEGSGSKQKSSKPDDFSAVFDGNTDDYFRLGLTVSLRSVRLYSQFYESDIIIASPVGLRTLIKAEGENNRDFDFLSSIEVMILDQADVFLMQNWDHINHLMQHMHRMPKQSRGVDFSRVYMWAINNWAKFYRQTLIISDVTCPEILSLANRHSYNYDGRVVTNSKVTGGSIRQIVTHLPHVFHQFDCDNYTEEADKRFDYFINKILPQFRETVMSHTAILIPSYFDFVRVRNHFKKNEISTALISEYTKPSALGNKRRDFQQGDKHFLLFTERFHYFYRTKIPTIKHMIFYQLPQYAHFFPELCNMIDVKTHSDMNNTCTVLYSKFDLHRLSATVNSHRCAQMLSSEQNIHMFVTGDNS